MGDVAKPNTYKRNMYLRRLGILKSEVQIPLKSNDLLFLNISNNLENVLLSFQMCCLLILTNVYLIFCRLADFIVLNKTIFGGGGREPSSNADRNK